MSFLDTNSIHARRSKEQPRKCLKRINKKYVYLLSTKEVLTGKVHKINAKNEKLKLRFNFL